jgi:hypothetical protein
MPLDNIFYTNAIWFRTFAWFPKWSHISGQLIWLRFAMEGTEITGLGISDLKWIWLTEQEYLIYLLRTRS